MTEVLFHDSPERMLANNSKLSYRKVGRQLTSAVPVGFPKLPKGSQLDVTWGRAHRPTWSASLSCLGIMIFAPLLVMFSGITLSQYQGSLFNSITAIYPEGPWQFVERYIRIPSLRVFGVYPAWVLTQAALYNYLPAQLSAGQRTPAGYLLQYHTNGLSAWTLTHIVLFYGVLLRIVDPAWIAKNWPGLLVVANSYGFLLSALAYIKAYIAPTHAKDRKFSGMQY
jgi:7-dehydrocholesterol reductase